MKVAKLLLFTLTLIFPLAGKQALLTSSALAELEPESRASALTVSPVIIEATIAPGKSYSRKATVKNETDYFIPVKVAPKSWEAEDLTGSAIPLEFIPSGVEGPEPKSAAQWIKLSETDFILEPKESKKVEVRVRVPKSAPPGGHYPALSFRPVIPEYLAPGVAVETEIIALMFITVPGKLRYEAEIESFKVNRSFFYKGEPTFSLILKNKGNVHIKATGPITLYGPFNRPAAKGYVPGPLTVLPGVRRLFKFSSPKPFWPGKYRATVDLTLEDGQTLSASSGFWYLPDLVPPILFLLLLTLTAGALKARKRLIPAVRILLKGRT